MKLECEFYNICLIVEEVFIDLPYLNRQEATGQIRAQWRCISCASTEALAAVAAVALVQSNKILSTI